MEPYSPISALVGSFDSSKLPPTLGLRVTKDVQRQQFAFVELREAMQANIPLLATRSPRRD